MALCYRFINSAYLQVVYEYVFAHLDADENFLVYRMFPRELIQFDTDETIGSMNIMGPLAIEFSPDYPDPLSYLDEVMTH